MFPLITIFKEKTIPTVSLSREIRWPKPEPPAECLSYCMYVCLFLKDGKITSVSRVNLMTLTLSILKENTGVFHCHPTAGYALE